MNNFDKINYHKKRIVFKTVFVVVFVKI